MAADCQMDCAVFPCDSTVGLVFDVQQRLLCNGAQLFTASDSSVVYTACGSVVAACVWVLEG